MANASDSASGKRVRQPRATWLAFGFCLLGGGVGVTLAAAPPGEVLRQWRAEAERIDRERESDLPAAYARALRWEQDAPASLLAQERVRMLLALADLEEDLGKHEKMEQRVAAAEQLAAETRDEVSLGRAGLRRAIRSELNGDMLTALAIAERALEHLERSRQPREIVMGLTQVAYFRDATGNTSDAVEALHRAEEMALGLKDERLLSAIDLGYAWAYHHAGRYAEGKRYGLKAVEEARRVGAKNAEAQALQVAAASTGRGGNRPEAEKLFRRSLALYREVRAPVSLVSALHNLVLNLRNQGKYEEMLPLLEEALALDGASWRIERTRLLGLRADARLNLGRREEALADAELSYAEARETKLWNLIADSAGTLKEVLAAMGDFRRAYEMAQTESEATEKRGRERIDLRVAELEKIYAAERKQREIDRLEASNRQQAADLRARAATESRLQLILSGGVILTALVGLLFFRERRARSGALALNAQLTRAKDELEGVTQLQSTVIDGTNYGIVVVDAEDRLIRIFSAGAERILGYRREEMVLKQRPMLFYDMAQIAERAVEWERESGLKLDSPVDVVIAAVRAGGTEEREWRFRHKDGRLVPVLLNITATRAADGRIVSYVGFLYDLSERKLAEAAMRESEDRFRQAFENAGIGMALLAHPDGRWQRVNHALCAMLGYTEAEMRALTTLDITHPDDVSRVLASVDEVVRGERQVMQIEKRYRHKNGDYVWVRSTSSLLRRAGGSVIGAILQIEDITARMRAETALRESEGRFRQAFENAGIGIAITDMAHHFVSVNRAFVEMVGVEPEALLGRSIFEISHPDDVALSQAEAVRLLKREISRGCVEKRYLRADRRVLWVRSTFTLIDDAHGAPLHFISQIEDITARKEAEAALREANERLRLTFDYAGIGMCMIGLDGRITRVNRRLCEILGDTEAALLEKQVNEIIHPDDAAANHADVQMLQPGGEPFSQRDLRLRRPDGSELWVRRTMAMLRDSANEPICIAAQIEDITDHRQYEVEIRTARDRAVELARVKSQFLANMSHEIRTPMNGIVGLTDALSSTRLDAEQREMIRLVQGSADSLLTIINDILDFSKIEAGRLELESLPFSVDELIRDTAALFMPGAREKGLSFECLVAPGCRLTAFGDPVRVRQVLSNLVGNAIKFTSCGRVSIRATILEGEPSRLRVEVADSGIGVPADRKAALFQPFTQAEQGHTRKFGGTGLGLAISRELVTLMHGGIGFTSEAGRGSTFWFELPLDRTNVAGAAGATAVAAPPAACDRPLRILVAEDNATNRMVLGHLLAEMPHTTDYAENGRVALKMLAGRRYDLVLMDCQMPDIDGFEATRQIRAGAVAGVDPQIPILALTAYAMTGDRERCIAAGMDDYLSKPVKAASLRAAIARHGARGGAAPAAPALGEAPPQPDDLVCDPAHLRELAAVERMDGESLLQAALAILYTETPERLANIATGVASGEFAQVAAIAHQLTGSAANMGAAMLRRASRTLEDAAVRRDAAAVALAQQELQRAWHRLDAFLRREKFWNGRVS